MRGLLGFFFISWSAAFPVPPDVSCDSVSPRWRYLKDFSWHVQRLKPSYVNSTFCSSFLDQFDDLRSDTPVIDHPCPLGLLTLQALRVLSISVQNFDELNARLDILSSLFKFYILSNNLYPPVSNAAWPLILTSDWPLVKVLARLHGELRVELNSRCGGDSLEHQGVWKELRHAIDLTFSEIRDVSLEETEIVRLSEQSRRKWATVYHGNFTISARLADEAFSLFNSEWWKQDCISGFMTIYLYRSVPFLVREKEGWGGRFFAGMNALMNEAGLQDVLESEWPVFGVLDLLTRLTRGDNVGKYHAEIFGKIAHVSEMIGKFDLLLQDVISETAEIFTSGRVKSLEDLSSRQRLVFLADKYERNVKLVYIAAVYGRYGKFMRKWYNKTAKEVGFVVILALDEEAEQACTEIYVCLKLSGVLPKSVISKFVVAEIFLQEGFDVVLVDIDTWFFKDPTQRLLEAGGEVDVVVPMFYLTDNLNPYIVYYKASEGGRKIVSDLKQWLYVNPFGEEHLAFDAVLGHRAWDVYIKKYQDASNLSWFFSHHKFEVKFFILDSKSQFVSADGWIGSETDIKIFHFWGANESVEDLFNCFSLYHSCISAYMKIPQYGVIVDKNFHITAISYASGCCKAAQALNAKTALAFGANKTIEYSEADVDENFKLDHRAIWEQRRGGGYWIWKPYLVLKTLLSDQVQWGDVIVYLDAGNHYIGDLQSKVVELLSETDVSGGYLKCCIESDWTKRDALVLLNGDRSPILDRPQMAAYFLLFRKTPVSIEFVKQWLKACTDPRIVTDLPNTLSLDNYPTFTNHIHDQAAFSIIFKQFGFKGFDLDRAHEVMKLARWRD
ncbi:hypothetical protein C9890_0639 [Perkinsus sp. BL_2016]|nr:hypothetical protein C9890_0639 [Perkinsus sp. BL_2016]